MLVLLECREGKQRPIEQLGSRTKAAGAGTLLFAFVDLHGSFNS